MTEIMWHKSTRSAGGNCVEVAWHKSSHSLNGNCVEAGAGGCGHVHVRDTKDREGGELRFAPQVWAEFLATLKDPALG